MAFAWKGSQGGGTLLLGVGVAGRSFAPPPPPSGGTITMNAPTVTTQALLVAPAPIWLEVTGVTGAEDETGASISKPVSDFDWDPTYHKVTYIWTVEEETSPGVWTQMTGTYPRVVNMVTAWNMAYVAYGKRVAFRLPDPGTYRFRVWCVDMQGNTGESVSGSYVVQDPDVAFSAADTIIYAGDGDFAGAPAGSTQVTSLAALNSAIASRTNPTRVRFKPGETVSGLVEIEMGCRADYIDTWTPGQKVTRRSAMVADSEFMYRVNDANSQTQLTWVDHIFQADWDEETETGDPGGSVFETRFVTQEVKMLIYNCDFTGFGAPWLSLNTLSGDRRWMVADTICTNWFGYGFYGERNPEGEYDLLGCTLARSANHLHGAYPPLKSLIRNDHNALRLANARHMYLACCDFFGASGWSIGGPNGLPAANACVRLFFFPTENPQSLNVDRCVAESGYITWKMDGENENALEWPGNYLFDKVLTICSARTIFPWYTAMGGVTRRNCYTWAPDIPYYDEPGGIRWEVQYEQNGVNTPANNDTFPMLNYCNTLLVEADFAQVPFTDSFVTDFSLYERQNTVNHQPSTTVPVTTFAPINTNPATELVPGVTPRTNGVRWNYQLIIRTGVSVPNGGTLLIPYADIDSSNGAGLGDTTPTTQAYWQALPPTDNRHSLSDGPSTAQINRLFQASRGAFTVSYADATNITITNTSGVTWGPVVMVNLDRKSRLATDIPALTQYASPSSIPMPRPQAGSSALNALGATDYRPHDSFDAPGVSGVARTRTDAGAVEA